MAKPKTKTELIDELKLLIKQANYLPKSEINRWLLIVDYLEIDELKETYDHFYKTYEEQRDIKLKMIHDAKLDDQYLQKIDEVTKDYMKKAKQLNK